MKILNLVSQKKKKMEKNNLNDSLNLQNKIFFG